MDVTPSTRPDRRPRRPRRGRTVARIAAVAAATTATAMVATGAFGPSSQPAAADGLRAFDGCAEVQDWYVDALRPLVGPYGIGGGGYGIAFATAEAGASRADAVPLAADAGPQSGAVGNGATGTNLQEAGVDEPDLMKTRDGLLVTTSGDRLVVLDVTGERPRELGTLQVAGLGAAAGWGPWGVADDSAPQPGSAELLLDGDRVVLLSSGWAAESGSTTTQDQQRSSWPGPVGSPTTTTTVVDVSDPSEPRLVSQQEVEGTLVGARLTEGVVRVVTTSTPALPAAEPRLLPGGNLDPTWEGEATAANLLALEQMSGEDFLPATIERDADGTVTGTTPAVACADLAHPAAAAGGGTVLVRSLDLGLDDDPVVDSTAVSADGDLVYASADRLYVATTRGGWSRWAGGVAIDGDADVDDVTTELHGFSTDQGATTTYVASGEVEGFLLGRWAMSAQDGLLRVATTVGQVWGPVEGQDPSESFVTVLAEQDGTLVQRGQVGGLGEGETIRAVRWFGDRATVVTFRQTDPLYVVDLSDPTAPAVTGELKVPGYSAYLHPVGDDRLVGIGQDATDEGRTTGVLVQTFDVSDPAAPTQVDTWTQENTWTSVEQDSRQFSYLPDQRLAIMPIDTMDGSAVQAFSVGEDGTIDAAGTYRAGSQQQWASVLRVMPVGDSVAVLTAGQQGGVVTMLDLDDLSATGSVALD